MSDLFDWSSTAASNTTVDGIGIDTNMNVGNVDNALRSIMALIRATFTSSLKNFLAGSAGLGVASGGTGAQTLTGILQGNGTSAVTAITVPASTVKFLRGDGAFDIPIESFILKVTDDATVVATGTGLAYFDLPYAITLSSVRATLAVAQTSGTTTAIDVNLNGSTIFSTGLTIDNTETTSTSAAVPSVLSTTALTDGGRITVDVDAIGDGTAKGLVVTLIGKQA